MRICPHCQRPIPIAYHKTSAGIVMRVEACDCQRKERAQAKRQALCIMVGAIMGGIAAVPLSWSIAAATAVPVFVAGLALRIWASRPLRA